VTAWVVLILFFSTLVRSTLGFGDALLAMPLLAMLLGIRSATPLVAMAASTIALLILIQDWRKADFRSALRLVLSTLPGIPFGLFFLKTINEAVVNLVLAILLIFFSLLRLLRLRLWHLDSDRYAFPFGFVAGLLGGAYNTNGPPAILYAVLRGWDPRKFRATLQGYFLPTGGAILIGHGLAGLWTGQVVGFYLWSLPAIVFALFLGSRIHRAIPVERFSRGVDIALLALGSTLLLRSLAG
jgi:uncharacterized membrane protein YfcA